MPQHLNNYRKVVITSRGNIKIPCNPSAAWVIHQVRRATKRSQYVAGRQAETSKPRRGPCIDFGDRRRREVVVGTADRGGGGGRERRGR